MRSDARANVTAEQTHPRTQRETHYVPWDVPGRQIVQALCGEFVRRAVDHSNEPSCQACRERRDELNAMEIA